MIGMGWQPEGRLMFQAEIFRAVLAAGTPGIKLTELRKVWGCSSRYGTLTQLYRELEDMVASGQLYRDDALANNTYRTQLTSDQYCQMTGESPLNFRVATERPYRIKQKKQPKKKPKKQRATSQKNSSKRSKSPR